MKLIDAIIRDVSELPDRDSPDDLPEAMLVTVDELREILQRNLSTNVPKVKREIKKSKPVAIVERTLGEQMSVKILNYTPLHHGDLLFKSSQPRKWVSLSEDRKSELMGIHWHTRMDLIEATQEELKQLNAPEKG